MEFGLTKIYLPMRLIRSGDSTLDPSVSASAELCWNPRTCRATGSVGKIGDRRSRADQVSLIGCHRSGGPERYRSHRHQRPDKRLREILGRHSVLAKMAAVRDTPVWTATTVHTANPEKRRSDLLL